MNAKRKTEQNEPDPWAPTPDEPVQANDTMETPGEFQPERETAEAPAAEAPAEEVDVAVQRLTDRLLRLQADFDNLRKRTQRERAELIATANEELIEGILPLLDHFELGLQNARNHEANASVLDGLQLVFDQFMSFLGRFGLDPVDADGKPFDPHQHEAITHLPSEEHPADTVMVQTRRGFRLGSKLLRPAQVVVSSGPQESAKTNQDPSDHARNQA